MKHFLDGKQLLFISVIFLLSAPAIGAQTGNLDRQQVFGQVAGEWVKIGIIQYQRGFYEQSKQSLLLAQGYQEYLTAGEREALDQYLEKTGQVEIKRNQVLSHIETADQLAGQGQVIKARAHLEKIKNSPLLSPVELKEVSKTLAGLAGQLDEQKKKIAELYNRSVEFYNAGRLEDARRGFIEVAGSGLLAASVPKTPEEYLTKIYGALGGRVKSWDSAETKPAADISESTFAQAKAASHKAESVSDEESMGEQLNATAAVIIDESHYAAAINRRRNLRRSYGRALTGDAVTKAHRYISEGKFYKAKEAVEFAEGVINKNRRHLGDELVRFYKDELGQMGVLIAQGRAEWLDAVRAESGRGFISLQP